LDIDLGRKSDRADPLGFIFQQDDVLAAVAPRLDIAWQILCHKKVYVFFKNILPRPAT